MGDEATLTGVRVLNCSNLNGIYFWCGQFHVLVRCPSGGEEGSSMAGLWSNNMACAGGVKALGLWVVAVRDGYLGQRWAG